MKGIYFSILLLLFAATAVGQNPNDNLYLDPQTGCHVWSQRYSPYDSIFWKGECKNNFAQGKVNITWYLAGKEVVHYTGIVDQGLPHGQGKLSWGMGFKVEGNFRQGEFLNLEAKYLQQLHRHTISDNDTANHYVNDGQLQTLFYEVLVPKQPIKGVLVLICGTWETVEDNLSSNQQLIQLAYDKGIAVIVPSLNQRLTLITPIVEFYNTVFNDAIARYQLPREKFVMGGWSMGGLHSLRYGELANQNPQQTAVVPKAVFSVDGPVDLETIYYNFQEKSLKFPERGEPRYGIAELERYTGGSPSQVKSRYIHYSNYTHSEADGGNAQYLKHTPVRIYGDVDVNWWMENRRVDMYDMNALDQSAMILWLNEQGNSRAEFINAYQKGYRLGGARHPHSWSIVEPVDCVDWILKCLE